LDSAGQRQLFRQQARQEAERWSWSAATQQLEEYYRAVIAESGSRLRK
jgi:glycosyltransferase involved in cell wall biosynthesis